jgi:hypothetical protein
MSKHEDSTEATNAANRAAAQAEQQAARDREEADRRRAEEQAQLPVGTRLTAPQPHMAPGVLPGPQYGTDGRLTREGMEAVLARGGSVLMTRQVEGQSPHAQIINDPRNLPTPEELAGHDENALNAADESLAAEQRRLDQRRAVLERNRSASKEAAKTAKK